MQKRKIGEGILDSLFFTADLHLGHSKIHLPDYANRPWNNVDDMDEGLIDAWNAKVPPNGLVVVAGDLLWDARRVGEYLPRLNGRVIYVLGDHGIVEPGKRGSEFFEAIYHILTLKMPNDRPDITVNHWAMRKWPKGHYGSWHLFGHSHGELGPWGRSFDCGVDANRGVHASLYAPMSYQEVCDRISRIERSRGYVPPVHHGRRG